MAEAIPVLSWKQSDKLAATLNSPPLTWIWHSVALRKGTTPGSSRWMSAPRERKSSAPCEGMFKPYFMVASDSELQVGRHDARPGKKLQAPKSKLQRNLKLQATIQKPEAKGFAQNCHSKVP